MLVNKKSIRLNLFRNPTKRIMFSWIDLNYLLSTCIKIIRQQSMSYHLNKKTILLTISTTTIYNHNKIHFSYIEKN